MTLYRKIDATGMLLIDRNTVEGEDDWQAHVRAGTEQIVVKHYGSEYYVAEDSFTMRMLTAAERAAAVPDGPADQLVFAVCLVAFVPAMEVG